MKQNLKKMISYYKPYLGVFFIDMFFALLAAVAALVIPLIVRYITSTVVYLPEQDAVKTIGKTVYHQAKHAAKNNWHFPSHKQISSG